MEATKGRFESMRILDAEDIARSVLHAVTAPPHVNINEVLVMPTEQRV